MKKTKKFFRVIFWILIIATIVSIQIDSRNIANIGSLVWVFLFLILVLEIIYYMKYKEILHTKSILRSKSDNSVK